MRFTKELGLKIPAETANSVMASLKANRAYVPMIQYLCTEGIKERHWNEIYDLLGFDETYRNDFLQDGVKDYKDIVKISDIKG